MPMNFPDLLLLNNYCLTCSGGKLLQKLESSFILEHKPLLRCIIIFSEDFSEQDIDNFRSQNNPGLIMLRANGRLSDKWQGLQREYFSYELNNLIALIDHEGMIIKAASPECQCYEQVFSFARTAIEYSNSGAVP